MDTFIVAQFGDGGFVEEVNTESVTTQFGAINNVLAADKVGGSTE